jgi:hypothetical protein
MEIFVAFATIVAAGGSCLGRLPLSLVSRTITRYGGVIINRDSEALIAVFGIERPEDAPIAAVKAALALQRKSRRFDGAESSPKIGIITGEVTVQMEEASAYEVVGDSIALAVQLCRRARSGEILIDGSTRHKVADSFDLEDWNERGTILKGQSEALETFMVRKDLSSHVSSAIPAISPDIGQVVVESVESTASISSVAATVQDLVCCTVFAPPAVARADSFLVQVFLHLPEETEEARELATEFDASAVRRVFKSLASRVARGTKLLFELAMPGLEINDTIQSAIWMGRTEAVQFGVAVPPDFNPCTVIGTVTVSENTVPIGHLKFKLDVLPVMSTRQQEKAEPAGDSARRYSMAFISYASKDRDEVIKRVQLLRPLGIRYFQDVLDLEPGDRWAKELYRRINECDLFLLFWSSAAKESTWVMKEVNHALSIKGDDDFAPPEIRPVIIEGPPVPLPPPELSHLHFNDRLIYFLS